MHFKRYGDGLAGVLDWAEQHHQSTPTDLSITYQPSYIYPWANVGCVPTSKALSRMNTWSRDLLLFL